MLRSRRCAAKCAASVDVTGTRRYFDLLYDRVSFAFTEYCFGNEERWQQNRDISFQPLSQFYATNVAAGECYADFALWW
jgi:hypothetical protein